MSTPISIPTMKPLGIRQEIAAIWMFVKRAFRLQTHFKFSYVVGLLGTVSTLVMYGMIARFGTEVPEINTLSGGYINFVISGLVLNTLLTTALSGPYSGLMECFWSNRAEIIMVSPLRLPVFVTGLSAGRYVDTFLRIGIYLLGGTFFLGFRWPQAPAFLSCLFVLLLGLAACIGLGLAAASMIYLLDARGGQDPIQFVVEVVSGLVAGVYFPLQVLPGWAQGVAHLIPHTYALDGMRRALFGGASVPVLPIHRMLGLNPLAIDALVLLGYALIVLPVGWRLFRRGIDLARTDGRLSRWL